MPFRAHYAKKEAREHSIAQNALAAGDLKEWHKHEAKAHRAGKHARGSGLMHTDYLMLGKENMTPGMGMGMGMGMGTGMGIPTGIPVGGPMPLEQPPIYTSSASCTMISTTSPLSPIEVIEGSPYQQGLPAMMSGGLDATYGGGMATLEPTIIVEPAIVEDARTVIEYGEPMMPVMDNAFPAVMSTGVASMSMMPAVASSETVAVTSMFTETQYGAPQFVGENVMML